tara:strand:- start:15829 stop:16500 length:672 start_codon:yes stop_codon:yes gene_type:complete
MLPLNNDKALEQVNPNLVKTMTDIPRDIANAGPYVRKRYRDMISNGVKPKMAEMLALQQAPMTKTDREFLSGAKRLGDVFGPMELQMLKDKAKQQGVTLTGTEHYCSALANEPLDPLACVPATGGRGHVKKVCEQRGWECQGDVKVEPKCFETDAYSSGKTLHPELVAAEAAERLSQNPDLVKTPDDAKALEQQIIEDHGVDDSNMSGESSLPLNTLHQKQEK